MKITQQAIYNLVGGGNFPNEDQQWAWAGPEEEQQAQSLIEQALNEIPASLADIWVKRELDGLDFDELADNRERARQLHAKAARRLRGVLIKMGKVLFLKDSIQVTYIPDGPRDPAWASVAEAASITGLSKRHIRHLARGKNIESQKVRGMVYIRKESLKAWIESSPIRGVKKGTWKD